VQRTTVVFVALAAALLLGAVPAAAQPYGPPEGSIQFSAFGVYRFGGEFDSVDFDDEVFDLIDLEVDDGGGFGVALDARLSGGLFLELWVSRQESDVAENAGIFLPADALFDITIDYYHAGLLYEWLPGQAHPFFAFSMGATRFEPDSPGLDDLIRLSFSFGGGVKVMFSDNVGLRAEGRFVSTLIEEDDDEFCDVHVCYDFDDDVYFYQTEARAGVVVAF
jgi:hypothetical protein